MQAGIVDPEIQEERECWGAKLHWHSRYKAGPLDKLDLPADNMNAT